jgi:hypothetical protein
MDSIGRDCTFEKEHDMAGSPISQQAQYADDYLTCQILGPRVQFLVDAVTFAADGAIYWAMPIRGRIVKIKAIAEANVLCPQPVSLVTSLLSTPTVPIFTSALGKSSTVTIAYTTGSIPAVVSWAGHGLVAGTPVVFGAVTSEPTGITAGTVYYVSAFSLASGSFKIADTQSHALSALDDTNSILISAAGVGAQYAVSNIPAGASVIGVYSDSGAQGGANYAADTVLQTAVSTVIARSCAITLAASGVVTWPGHNFADNTPVVFTAGTGTLSATVPVSGTTYYVKHTAKTANTFEVSAASGDGAAIAFNGVGGVSPWMVTATPAPTAGALRLEITIEPTFN